jgi:hypothetical protein
MGPDCEVHVDLGGSVARENPAQQGKNRVVG